MPDYDTIYKVYHLQNGQLEQDLSTKDKDLAVDTVRKLRSKGAKQAHIQLAFNKGGKLNKRPFKVRFHLGKGKNFGKWKIENTITKENTFLDPDEVQLNMRNCKLTNRPKTAEKIFSGEQNKAPIAYVQCSVVDIIDKDNFVAYNPRKQPNWINSEGNNIDNYEFNEIVSENRKLFVKDPMGYFEIGGVLGVGLNNGFAVQLEQGGQLDQANVIPREVTTKLGKKIKIKMPNGETRSGQFALIDLSDLIASHHERSFATSEGYPTDKNGENINDRNYTDDKNAQAKVIEIARDLDADRLVVTSRTPDGTPIIDENGYVVSGNNRTMSLKLAKDDHPEKFREYQEFLEEEIEAFGLEEKDLRKFTDPIIVRIDYDIPALNTMELSKYNKDEKKAERPIDKAIKLGKLVDNNEKCKTTIGDIVGRYETFSDFYSNFNDQKTMLDSLTSCNILTTQEKPRYWYERGFTDQGKELIENLLAGMVLSKAALMIANDVARKFRSIIITSLPVLTLNNSFREESLSKPLNEAIEVEGKIKASKLDFSNWINQISLFDNPPTREALYMNRLLASGRNNFKRSMENYNASVQANQGESLFGDKPTKEEIFTAHIINNVPDADRKLIERTVEKFETTAKEEVPPAPAPAPAAPIKTTPQNPFENGNYFNTNPDNILADMATATDRWKKPITIYKGTIEEVDRIVAPETFLQATKKENATTTVIDIPVEKMTDKNAGIADNLEKAITQSPKDQIKKTKKKKSKKTTTHTAPAELETLSIQEVFDMCNEGLDKTDVQVFLWYQSCIGRPVNNPEWYSLAGTDMTTIESITIDPKNWSLERLSSIVLEWIKTHRVFYYAGELLPEYLYVSGNVYEKIEAIMLSELSDNVGEDALFISEHFGDNVLQAQQEKLNEVWQIKYDNRLIIKPNDDETGLKIIPISTFCKKFMIKHLADEIPFAWKKITATTDKNYGRIDILADEPPNHKKVEFPELSLTDAFTYWLKTDKSISIKQGINYVDIIKYYIYGKNKPASKYKSHAEIERIGKKSGATPEQIAKVKAKHGNTKEEDKAIFERLKSKAKSEGDRLFNYFLDKVISLNDKVAIETEWNRTYNNNVPVKFDKIPVAFRMNKYIFGEPLDVRPEKREAVAFTLSNGTGLLAYDVGVGKTPAAIFTICQFIDMGYCQRPLVVVPNQTYKQWISEFNNFAGHLKINGLYNLSDEIIKEWQINNGKDMVEPGSVTIITEHGFLQLGFTEETEELIEPEIRAILKQDTSGLTEKKRDLRAIKLASDVDDLIGRSLARTKITLEEFGFDYLCLDEAHNAKKVFTMVAGQAEENTGIKQGKGKVRKEYKIQSGSPSNIGIKAFIVSHYLQLKYKGNVQLLTATPFTNSPLEIYSMLAMLGYNTLKQMNLNNLVEFFDTFIEVSYELTINIKMRPVRKQVIMGFSNLLALQQLVRRFISHKTGESVGVKRPMKWVLPLKSKMVDNVLMELSDQEQVGCEIPLTPVQQDMMLNIKRYAEGEIDENMLCSGAVINADENPDAATDPGEEISESSLDEDEKAGVRLLKAMAHGRNLALSPYLFDCGGLGKPTPKEYIETSNKLTYVMDCIRSIKDHHESNNTLMGGVVIYMDRGVDYFPLIRKYLIENMGFAKNEVGIISGQHKVPVPKGIKAEDRKEYVKNLFLGEKFNPETQLMEYIPDSERIKVLIGSSTIREGINLQKFSSTLFNCFLPFNPTDVQQLTGRIYRQKNAFQNVRIVNPLMIDSMDIFMFQKLEEKTNRINTIWQSDGKTNVLKTEEFNPKELKYSLIKNPEVIAEMEVIDEKENIDEQISDLKNQKSKIETIKEYNLIIQNYDSSLNDWIVMYRPKAYNKDLDHRIRQAQIVLRKQTDQEGLPMVYSTERTDPDIVYSSKTPAERPSWLDRLITATRNLDRIERDYLKPNGYDLNTDLKILETDIDNKIASKEDFKTKLNSEELINERIDKVIEKQEKLQVRPKSISEMVEQFKSLNYLLDDVKLKPHQLKTPAPAPQEFGADKDELTKALKGAESVVKYLKGNEKKETETYIKGLITVLKYM